MSQQNIQIIAFVGMTGSGKTTAVNYLSGKGFPKIYSGGMLFDEMERRGIDITLESQRSFRHEIRKEYGNEHLAKLCAEQMHNLIHAGQKKIVLDGPYTWPEYLYLKREFPGCITVVATVAPRKVRHKRLSRRTERPQNSHESLDRDQTEIEGLEKAGPIAMADHYILGDASLEDFYTSIDSLASELGFFA